MATLVLMLGLGITYPYHEDVAHRPASQLQIEGTLTSLQSDVEEMTSELINAERESVRAENGWTLDSSVDVAHGVNSCPQGWAEDNNEVIISGNIDGNIIQHQRLDFVLQASDKQEPPVCYGVQLVAKREAEKEKLNSNELIITLFKERKKNEDNSLPKECVKAEKEDKYTTTKSKICEANQKAIDEWKQKPYHLLTHNCQDFAKSVQKFIENLGQKIAEQDS